MAERRYGKVGSGAIRAPSMEPRKGVVAVAAKQPMEVPAARPERAINGLEDLAASHEEDRRAHLSQGNTTDPVCRCCGATESSEVIVRIEIAEPVSLCGACVELLVDKLRSELPRRRLRLAMERLAAGDVSMETVEAIERMAGASGAVRE